MLLDPNAWRAAGQGEVRLIQWCGRVASSPFGRQAAGPGSALPQRVAPELGRKLNYLLGKTSGNKHNIERSTQMFRQLRSIGLGDTPATRQLLKDHFTQVANDPSNIAKINPENGRIIRESLLSGPKGCVKVESIWDANKLITANLFGGKFFGANK